MASAAFTFLLSIPQYTGEKTNQFGRLKGNLWVSCNGSQYFNKSIILIINFLRGFAYNLLYK